MDRTTGYAKVTIYNDAGELKTVSVHRAVCSAFHGPPPFLGAQVRHQNGRKGNNRETNLRWGTRLDNAVDRMAHGGYDSDIWAKPIPGRFLGELKSLRSVRVAYRAGKISKNRALSIIAGLSPP